MFCQKKSIFAFVLLLLSFTGNLIAQKDGEPDVRPIYGDRRSSKKLTKALPQGDYILYDDMYLPAATIKSASPLRFNKWVDGILPISFPSSVTESQKAAFFAACQWWGAYAKISCQLRTNERDYITVAPSTGNDSKVGRIGGEQRMNIYNWNVPGIMAHEIGHTLGLVHEHMRVDRDYYVTIVWANIDPKYKHNFDRIDSQNWSYYDYESIMHYPPKAFSVNGQPTIIAKDPQAAVNMGQNSYLSRRDHLAALKMYGPRGNVPTYQLPNILGQELFRASSLLRIDYGINVAVTSGPTSGKWVTLNICEAEEYYPVVLTQTPAAGTLVPYGFTVNVTTKMGGESHSYPPPKGKICP